MKNFNLIAFLFLILLSACNKDEPIIENPISEASPIDNWNPVVENVSGSLVGQVNNESGAPISNATVTLNNETTSTNQYGFFVFENQTMNAKGSYVKVEKSGYFLGSRRFFPQANAQSNVKITLLEKAFNQSFSSDNESVMEFEGASVSFSANSIANQNGDAYTGNVNFAAKWLDPSSTDVFLEMPGNLQGVNAGSQEVALKTLGMIAVELEDDEGNELNILEGFTATISLPVPEELRANAPLEIPLWSFNEERGIWVEEGTALLENGSYVGKVKHFSFWNCDIPADYVDFTVTILNSNGDPLVDGIVVLVSENFGCASGSVNENGTVSGIIPANEILILRVFVPICESPILEQIIGPFSEDTDIGNLNIDFSEGIVTTISGTLTNCNDNPVTNGMLILNYTDGIYYHFVNSSDFSFTHTTCSLPNSMSITGVDFDNNVSGIPTELEPGTENNVGSLMACGSEDIPDYLNLTVAGETKYYLVTNVLQGTDSTRFNVDLENVEIAISFAGITTGSYGFPENLYRIDDSIQDWAFLSSLSADENTLLEFEVTEVNGKLHGIMAGELYNYYPLQIEAVSGEFLITIPE